MAKKKPDAPAPAGGVSMTLIMGYPGSGKSSLTKEKRFQGMYQANRDKVGGSIPDLANDAYYQLRLGKSVVADNLFASRESRKHFIDVAKTCGVPVFCVVQDTTIEDAQVNVVCRLIKHFGHFPTDDEIKTAKHPNIFPPAVLYKYRKDFQEPTTAEGFESVERVSFVRQPWPGKNRALLLDFDGTLRECPSGNKYPVDPADIAIRPKVAEILRKFEDSDWLLLGVSNQSGIAKGELTREQCVKCFAATNKKLGVEIETLFCAHRVPPISCYCRKPGVGMPVAHIVKHDLDPAKCVLVGDMTTDKTCAARVGMPYMHADVFFGEGHKQYV